MYNLGVANVVESGFGSAAIELGADRGTRCRNMISERRKKYRTASEDGCKCKLLEAKTRRVHCLMWLAPGFLNSAADF